MAKTSPMVVIGIVIIVALLMSSTIFAGFSGLLDKAWETWRGLFENMGGTGGCSISLHVTYEDGTTDDLTIDHRTLLPLSVYFGDNPKRILAVDFQVLGSFQYTGTLQSITQDTDLEFYFDSDLKQSGGATGSISSLPASNEVMTLAEMQVTAGSIAFWADQDGTYDCKIVARAALTITFTDGTTDTLSAGDIQGQFTFKVEGGMATTSLLSISINADAWHDA